MDLRLGSGSAAGMGPQSLRLHQLQPGCSSQAYSAFAARRLRVGLNAKRGNITEAAPADVLEDESLVRGVAVDVPGKRKLDGGPIMRIVPETEAVRLSSFTPSSISDEILEGIHLINSSAARGLPKPAEVPGGRVVLDPEELLLVGEGLPIIRGVSCFNVDLISRLSCWMLQSESAGQMFADHFSVVDPVSPLQEEWPDAYWKAIEAISGGSSVPLPRPHPKFAVQDLARVARDGPRFEDVVLEHVERTPTADGQLLGEAYSYVPSTVLGDWRFDVEPNWLNLPQMNYFDFYQVHACSARDAQQLSV